jgi:CDP-glucose 4,6-dehydratase
MMPEFWTGRRVLVTGHTGFKGAWLCLWLDVLGAEVHGYALDPPTTPSLYERAGIDRVVRSTIADVRDFAGLSACVETSRPEVVFHMAAQSLVLRSYDDPLETYSTNVLGTVHVLEAVRRAGSPCVMVNVTTDKVYENVHRERGYREDDALGGHDPYSSSKAASELVARAYRMSFFTPGDPRSSPVALASARAGNVVGGGDWTPGQLVPDAMAALGDGRPVSLRRPDAVRPWQHVLDCLNGYLTLAEALHSDSATYAGEWNFGPPESDCLPVAELVEELAERMRVRPPWVQDTVEHASEESLLRLDAGKAEELLGWRTLLSLSATLDWVTDWYRGVASDRDPAELCLEQLADYGALVMRSTLLADGHPTEPSVQDLCS